MSQTTRAALFAAVADALEKLATGDAAGAAAVERRLEGADSRTFRIFAEALAARWSARWDTITELLTRWTEGAAPHLWRAAAWGWGMAGRDSPETALVMLEKLLRAHPETARAVAAALPAIWPNHERYMRRVLTRWQADPLPTLRRVATRALARLEEPARPAESPREADVG